MAPLRRAWLLPAAVAASAAIAAFWTAPASLVDARLARMTGGTLRLANAEGTVWRARGDLAAGTASIPVAWRIDPWPLLQGELRVHVTPPAGSDAGSPRADIAVDDARVALRDVDVTLPASAFAAAMGSTVVWVAGGDVDVHAVAVDWSPPSSRGEARIRWRAANLVVPGGAAPVQLGEVSVVLTAEGDRLSGPIANEGGDLALHGEFTLRTNDSVHVSLVLAPRRTDDVILARALSAIGTADAGGWRVDWRLPLR